MKEVGSFNINLVLVPSCYETSIMYDEVCLPRLAVQNLSVPGKYWPTGCTVKSFYSTIRRYTSPTSINFPESNHTHCPVLLLFYFDEVIYKYIIDDQDKRLSKSPTDSPLGEAKRPCGLCPPESFCPIGPEIHKSYSFAVPWWRWRW